jgi:hypothetical protein
MAVLQFLHGQPARWPNTKLSACPLVPFLVLCQRYGQCFSWVCLLLYAAGLRSLPSRLALNVDAAGPSALLRWWASPAAQPCRYGAWLCLRCGPWLLERISSHWHDVPFIGFSYRSALFERNVIGKLSKGRHMLAAAACSPVLTQILLCACASMHLA